MAPEVLVDDEYTSTVDIYRYSQQELIFFSLGMTLYEFIDAHSGSVDEAVDEIFEFREVRFRIQNKKDEKLKQKATNERNLQMSRFPLTFGHGIFDMYSGEEYAMKLKTLITAMTSPAEIRPSAHQLLSEPVVRQLRNAGRDRLPTLQSWRDMVKWNVQIHPREAADFNECVEMGEDTASDLEDLTAKANAVIDEYLEELPGGECFNLLWDRWFNDEALRERSLGPFPSQQEQAQFYVKKARAIFADRIDYEPERLRTLLMYIRKMEDPEMLVSSLEELKADLSKQEEGQGSSDELQDALALVEANLAIFSNEPARALWRCNDMIQLSSAKQTTKIKISSKYQTNRDIFAKTLSRKHLASLGQGDHADLHEKYLRIVQGCYSVPTEEDFDDFYLILGFATWIMRKVEMARDSFLSVEKDEHALKDFKQDADAVITFLDSRIGLPPEQQIEEFEELLKWIETRGADGLEEQQREIREILAKLRCN